MKNLGIKHQSHEVTSRLNFIWSSPYQEIWRSPCQEDHPMLPWSNGSVPVTKKMDPILSWSNGEAPVRKKMKPMLSWGYWHLTAPVKKLSDGVMRLWCSPSRRRSSHVVKYWSRPCEENDQTHTHLLPQHRTEFWCLEFFQANSYPVKNFCLVSSNFMREKPLYYV